MNNIYVTSDIHGCFERFLNLVNSLNLKNDDILYVLGDVLDRGEHPIKTLLFIKNHPNIELIKGNHEEMLLDYVKDKQRGKYYEEVTKDLWTKSGGASTIAEFEKMPQSEQNEIVEYLKNLPLYIIVKNYILVHAGVNTSYEYSNIEELLKSQTEDDLLWIRKSFIYNKALDNHIVIFGHTRTISMYRENNIQLESCKIWIDPVYGDKIGIDCYAYSGYANGGRLACLNLKNLEAKYF